MKQWQFLIFRSLFGLLLWEKYKAKKLIFLSWEKDLNSSQKQSK